MPSATALAGDGRRISSSRVQAALRQESWFQCAKPALAAAHGAALKSSANAEYLNASLSIRRQLACITSVSKITKRDLRDLGFASSPAPPSGPARPKLARSSQHRHTYPRQIPKRRIVKLRRPRRI